MITIICDTNTVPYVLSQVQSTRVHRNVMLNIAVIKWASPFAINFGEAKSNLKQHIDEAVSRKMLTAIKVCHCQKFRLAKKFSKKCIKNNHHK